MVNNLTFDIAVSTRWPGEKLGLPASEHRWARYNNSFASVLGECLGQCCGAWCTNLDHKSIPGHCGRPRGYRCNRHFKSAQFIALDFDTGDERASIKCLNDRPLIAEYGNFLYTTLSHTPASPKARAVFIMDSAITDPDLYRRFKLAMMSQLPWGEASVHDPSRMFYGSHPRWGRSQFLGNFLPVAVVEGLVREHCSQMATEQAPRTRSRITSSRVFGTSPADHYINAAIDREVVSLSNKAEGTGERHKALLISSMKLASLSLSEWLPEETRERIDPYALLLPAAEVNGYIEKYGEISARQTMADGIAYAR